MGEKKTIKYLAACEVFMHAILRLKTLGYTKEELKEQINKIFDR